MNTYLQNKRTYCTRHGMPFHAVYRWLSRRLGWDGQSPATTYFVLRKHGMTASEAWALMRDGIGARDAWKSLPPERLSLYDRVFCASRTSAIDATMRGSRRRRKAANK